MLNLDWAWDDADDVGSRLDTAEWLRGRGWGTAERKYRRGDGVRMKTDLDEALRNLEYTAAYGEREAYKCAQAAAPALHGKWTDRIVQETARDFRRQMGAAGLDERAFASVAFDRAFIKSMHAYKDRWRRCLPFELDMRRIPHTRFAIGAHYGRPIVATGNLLNIPEFGFVELGAAIPEVERASYAEIARVETSWRIRFVWVSTDSFPAAKRAPVESGRQHETRTPFDNGLPPSAREHVNVWRDPRDDREE